MQCKNLTWRKVPFFKNMGKNYFFVVRFDEISLIKLKLMSITTLESLKLLKTSLKISLAM